MKKRKYNVIPQMFDVKPKNLAGNFDVEEINRKYFPIVKLNKNKKATFKKKRAPIVMPAKWDISHNVIAKQKKEAIVVKQRNLKELSDQARHKKVFQLNKFNKNNEVPAFISLEKEKFLGASKPFLNQSFDYRQEFFNKNRLKKEQLDLSLTEKIQNWWRVNERKKRRKEERRLKREALKNAIIEEKIRKEEHRLKEQENLKYLKLVEKAKAREAKILAKEIKKIELAKRKAEKRAIRKKKINRLISLINPFVSDFSEQNIFFDKKKQAFSFAMAVVVIFCGFWGIKTISYGFQIQDKIIVKGKNAVGELAYAKDDFEKQDFSSAIKKISNARKDFEEAGEKLDQAGGDLLNIFSKIPGLSKASSGKSMIKAGEKITEAAEELGALALIFLDEENSSNQINAESLKEIFIDSNERLVRAHEALNEAQTELNRVQEKDLPEEYRQKFLQIKELMPSIVGLVDDLEKNYEILWEILGFKGVRKYLLIFQNNQEIRATGGFIGSYGVLEMNDGKVKNLFIDGIYNPDGQLREKVVPPKPIQKISAAWSTHDANWFPDFPTSAEKVAWFYEKTGGPTVDGVIAITPTVMQKLLEITGPIEMPEYEITVDAENFIEKTQYEVEIDYDKDLNQPKKFIADLAPKVLEKIFVDKDISKLSKTLRILSESLKERHILIYSFNYNAQKVVSEQGWSGEVLQTGKDYLMVINTNLNGFKTDGVVDEKIEHKAEIQSDGSIINTVKITRKHNGGNADYEWWNKVNSNYMRIYVPKGSQLISAEGHTREFNSPPIDYDKLEFRRDPQVEGEEQSMKIDEATGTRIYEEENKTVFANWVYVSPQETVEVEYQYILPFKIDFSKNKDKMDSYSLLAQKQSGSIGSEFFSEITFPDEVEVFWRYPENLPLIEKGLNFKQMLNKDIFLGAVLREIE